MFKLWIYVIADCPVRQSDWRSVQRYWKDHQSNDPKYFEHFGMFLHCYFVFIIF